jgi:hypothetical protein
MKAERWIDGYITISEASRLSGKTRETVAKAARELPVREGPGNAKLYLGQDLFNALYDSGSYSETARQLNIARTAQIDLDMQCKRRERIPLCDVIAVNNEVDMAIAGIIKASGLPLDAINEIFDQIQTVGAKLVDAPVADMKNAIGPEAEDDKGYQEACAAQDKWHADINAAIAEPRMADEILGPS